MKQLLSRIYRRVRRTISVNRRIKNSQWYHNVFPHLEEYEAIQRNSDIICIGSTPAKFAIDFHGIDGIKGSNLATLPETVYYDFQVVKNYHSYLKKNGVIISVLCPFSFLKERYTSDDDNKNYLNIRYYPILHRALIDSFDYSLFDKWVENPYKIGLKAWIRAFNDAPKSKALLQDVNELSDDEMKVHAQQRINGWMDEFGLSCLDPEDGRFSVLQNTINHNTSIYKQLLEFAQERSYRFLVVIPPFSKELSALIPDCFVQAALLEPLKKIGVQYISYLCDDKWSQKDFFIDSFMMNKNGRMRLTRDIVERLKKKYN